MRIHSRLALITLAVTLVALGVATLLWNASLQRERRGELDQRLLDQARILALILPSAAPEEVPRIRSLVRRFSGETGIRYTVIRLDGVVLAESDLPDSAIAGMENHRERPEVLEALAAGSGRTERVSPTLKFPMAYLAVRWGPESAPFGVVRTALPMTHVIAEERRGLTRLLLVVAGSLALAVVLGQVASRRISRPLSRVSRTAREIAGGSLSRRVELEGPLEVREVGQALNQLAASVEAEIDLVEGARRRLERLLARMPDGILALDGEGKVSLVNDAARRLLGIDGEKTGRTPVELVRSAELQEGVDLTLADGRSRSLEIQLHYPERRLVTVNLVPLETGLVVLVHDVTRLRRLEEARREMVANIGHELRTPLAAILGYLETLEQDPGLSAEDRARFLAVITRNARRLERLVRDLSHLARLESSPEPLLSSRVDLHGVVAGALETFAIRAEGKEIRLVTDLARDLPPVKADSHGLETVLLNLLDNALRVTPSGGEIAVGARADDGWVRVWVNDHGPGIPREYRDRVFERFFRIDTGRSSEEGGSGLGLAIVKHTVLRMGGEIGVADAPGGGASFTLTLPRG